MVKNAKGSTKTFTTVSIPSPLFRKVEAEIRDKGFPSVSSYVTFLLRVVLSERGTSGRKSSVEREAELIKKRLEGLGYA